MCHNIIYQNTVVSKYFIRTSSLALACTVPLDAQQHHEVVPGHAS